MNKTEFIGNLTKDVELMTTNNGTSVARFTIAVRRKFKDANGEYQTDFFNCTAWRQAGETIHKFCHKGDKLYVGGELQNSHYEVDGEKRISTQLVVNDFEFLNTKNKQEELEPVEDDDNLPF